MNPGRLRPLPLSLRTDPARGGRWTSLRSPGREWLWTNPDPDIAQARTQVRPGSAFVDAGGAEECFPTVRGKPDHGDAWCRTWSTDGAKSTVDVPHVGRLSRRISGQDPVVVEYEVTGRRGTPFLHALHALLDLSSTARLAMPGSPRMTVLDVDDPEREWPNGLDTFGPDDGTAICALVLGATKSPSSMATTSSGSTGTPRMPRSYAPCCCGGTLPGGRRSDRTARSESSRWSVALLTCPPRTRAHALGSGPQAISVGFSA